ncbi:MAG: hypothetical protein L0332_30370 [Chloroflexi bacterium]|nr:hypothetical protein [Chloroflexota bacterium]
MNNWTSPRDTLLETSVTLVVERGYPVKEVAEMMARSHYYGPGRPQAAAFFARSLEPMVRARAQEKYRDEAAELQAMAEELAAEGWRFLKAFDDSPGGIWYHDAAGSVNNLGGNFSSYEEATRRAYSSPMRDWARRRARRSIG